MDKCHPSWISGHKYQPLNPSQIYCESCGRVVGTTREAQAQLSDDGGSGAFLDARFHTPETVGQIEGKRD